MAVEGEKKFGEGVMVKALKRKSQKGKGYLIKHGAK